jgi:hypothetical protein
MCNGSEAYTAEQKSLLEETLDMDLAAWPPRSRRCSPALTWSTRSLALA